MFGVIVFMFCGFSAVSSFGQEIPKPGTVINKDNYKKYAHLFPQEFLGAFENGFGFMPPISIKVSETKSMPLPKAFLALSEKNKGKYSLDAGGDIVGGWKREGMPFPDLQRDDKDFVTKLMWNFSVSYHGDEQRFKATAYVQRKGERLRWTVVETNRIFYMNRLVNSPKPMMPNPENLYNSILIRYLEPESSKNTMTLSLRYADPHKSDDVYIYLPNMRRVLRGEAGQRAVPLMGVNYALDDIDCFDGRTPEFTYKLVGEQKVLSCNDNVLYPSTISGKGKPNPTVVPFPTENWSVVDCYVVDIVAKDPKYPQSKKRLWINKENLHPTHVIVWDRAGQFWKYFMSVARPVQMPNDKPFAVIIGLFGLDVQFGMLVQVLMDNTINKGGLTWDDVSPTALVKKGR